MTEQKQLANELHKPITNKFDRRKVHSNGIDEIWSMDLVDMSQYAKENKDFKFMLNIIDVFSRYAWSTPLKNKSAETVLEAFENVMDQSKRIPQKIWVDQGTEFYNKKMDALLKKLNITRYSTYSPQKSVMVERFNRTLKTWMWKLFTEHQTHNWINLLRYLMNRYNNRIHSGLLFNSSPIEASKKEYETKALAQEKPPLMSKKSDIIFKIGDKVRISRLKGTFEKGYEPNWSTEIFTINRINQLYPPLYYLEDYKKQEVKGGFYSKELLKASNPDRYLIEKVLKYRTRDGKKQGFVKWLGFDNSHNTWVDNKNITDLKPN
jgi:hypothetical protein